MRIFSLGGGRRQRGKDPILGEGGDLRGFCRGPEDFSLQVGGEWLEEGRIYLRSFGRFKRFLFVSTEGHDKISFLSQLFEGSNKYKIISKA